MSRRALGLLLACALMGEATPCARADDLPTATRQMAELGMAEGRWEDLEGTLGAARTPRQRLPLEILAQWWRRSPGAAAAPLADDPLTARRLDWVAQGSQGPYPELREGESDPWPVLTALVQDRLHRERMGVQGLPHAGPLEACAERLDPQTQARTIWFLRDHTRWQMTVSFRQMPPSAAEIKAQVRAEELAARNGWLGLAAIVLLLLATVVWVWWVERRHLREA